MSDAHSPPTDPTWANGDPTDLRFQHANPHAGNESVLLRLGYDTGGKTACLLVDAGDDVDIDALLEDDDRLVGICLTHAHIDHYRSLPACVSADVPVFTSPDTAAMLADVFDVAADQQGMTGGDDVLDAVVPLEGWHDLCPGVELHPLPAGHTPGGAGFLVRIDDGTTHDIVFTGDFTETDCAGYPGFDTDLAADVDVLFLTGATADPYGEVLTAALGDTLERALDGGRTLVTASALTGVHVARLVSAANDAFDIDVPVRLVGQGAKHFETLGFDDDSVRTITEFEDPQDCLSPGTVTIAGPEVPTRDSSSRLFNLIKADNTAGLVQLIAGGHSPVDTGGCHTSAYELSMHPTESTLENVVETLDPVHTIVTHRSRSPEAWNDWPSTIWGAGDTDIYQLYRSGVWRTPPWMNHAQPRGQVGTSTIGAVSGEAFDDLPLPTLARSTPDLAAEGIDVDSLRERVRDAQQPPETTTSPEVVADGEGETTADDTPETDHLPRDGLHQTTTTPAPADASSAAAVDDQLPQATDIVSARAREQLFNTDETASETASSEESSEAEAQDGTDSQAEAENEPAESTDSPAEEGSDTEPSPTERSEASASDADGSLAAVEVDPLLATLIERRSESPERFVDDALRAYFGTLLRTEGELSDPPTGLSVELSGPLATEIDESEINVERALRIGAGFLSEAPTVTVDVGTHRELLEAAVDRFEVFDSPVDVLEAAVTDAVREDSSE